MSAATLWVIGAMLAQGVVLFVITALLYQERVPRIIRGEVAIRDVALDKSRWPESARLVANAYENQFELPVVFYVACFIAIEFGATPLEAALAALFVLTRIIHAAVHLTTNHVPRRFFAFAAGAGVIALFWFDLIVRLTLIAAKGTP